MNDRYINFKKAADLAEFIYVLVTKGAAYSVCAETNGTWSVLVTGF